MTRKGQELRSGGRGAGEDASRVHRDAVIIDGQGTSVLLPVALVPQPEADGKDFIGRAIEAGLTAMNVTMGIGGVGMGRDDLRALLDTIHGHYCFFELESERLVHVQTVGDIRRAKAERKLGVIFGVQGLSPKIEGDPNLLRILHRLGLRIAQLTYNERSSIGSGCLEPDDGGLTQFGRVCVREMNHLGILVDLAHAGDRTARDAIEFSEKPVIISHANARALCDSPRNVSDDTLRLLAGRGGVIGITAYSPFCETRPGVRPTLDDVIDHIAHVADLVGVDHVGLGSDFFEGESPVRFERFFRVRYPDVIRGYTLDTVYAEGFSRVDHLPRLTRRLGERGFSAGDVVKILGGNFLRVFERVWGR